MGARTARSYELNHWPVVKNGCRHHDDCFSCPFEDCVYDHHVTERGHRFATLRQAEETAAAVSNLVRQGIGRTRAVFMVAEEMGVSMETVWRRLKRAAALTDQA